jgi:GTP1/Obg family GTP-binding protein
LIFHSANDLRKRKRKIKGKRKKKIKRKRKKEKKKKKKKEKKRKEGIKELKEKPHEIIVTWPYLSSMAKFFLNLMLID